MIDQETFGQAIEAARGRFPKGVWERLPAGEKAEAIYAELRRIDPESAKGMIPINSGPSGRA
jgi:hypothetical protein